MHAACAHSPESALSAGSDRSAAWWRPSSGFWTGRRPVPCRSCDIPWPSGSWMVPSQASWRLSSAIRATVRAELRPWSRLPPPARASACSMLSQVITPKAQGTPVSSCTSWMPRSASALRAPGVGLLLVVDHLLVEGQPLVVERVPELVALGAQVGLVVGVGGGLDRHLL